MSDYLEAWFRASASPCRAAGDLARPRQPDRPVRRPRGRRTLLFDAHQDTVPDRRDDHRPVHARGRRRPSSTAGARATSRGGWRRCSPPSPAWSASGRPTRPRSIMACTVDEEFTHVGSDPLLAGPPRVPTWRSSPSRPSSTSSTATKGRSAGRSGPGGWPATPRRPSWARTRSTRWPGSSPRWPITPTSWPDSTPDPVLGLAGSLSVGRIEGGISANVVPDWCEVEIDRRSSPASVARATVPGRAATS